MEASVHLAGQMSPPLLNGPFTSPLLPSDSETDGADGFSQVQCLTWILSTRSISEFKHKVRFVTTHLQENVSMDDEEERVGLEKVLKETLSTRNETSFLAVLDEQEPSLGTIENITLLFQERVLDAIEESRKIFATLRQEDGREVLLRTLQRNLLLQYNQKLADLLEEEKENVSPELNIAESLRFLRQESFEEAPQQAQPQRKQPNRSIFQDSMKKYTLRQFFDRVFLGLPL